MRVLLIEAVSVAIAAVAALWGRREVKKRLSVEKENKQLEEQVDVLAHEEIERGPNFEALRRRAASGLLPTCNAGLRVVNTGGEGQIDLVCTLERDHAGDCFDGQYGVYFTQQGLTKWGER